MSKEIDELTAMILSIVAVEAAVDAYLDFGLTHDEVIEKMITKYNLSREEATIAVAEGEKRMNQFNAESNIEHLENIAKDIINGTAHFSEHDLIEE